MNKDIEAALLHLENTNDPEMIALISSRYEQRLKGDNVKLEKAQMLVNAISTRRGNSLAVVEMAVQRQDEIQNARRQPVMELIGKSKEVPTLANKPDVELTESRELTRSYAGFNDTASETQDLNQTQEQL